MEDQDAPPNPSTDSNSDTTGAQWIGPYRVLRRLGSGGMGEVFLAHDPRLERRVAIKRLLPQAFGSHPTIQARLRREARLAAQINHSAVAQIYDLLTLDDIDHIIMEFVSGQSLRELLAKGPLPWARALPILTGIATGLTFAHRHDIIHRDLKTENVIVDEQDQPKIVDFGIARPLATDREGSLGSLTHTGAVIGTSRAMSPEQAAGHSIDSRSDLFSFGVLIYEVLTGVSPFIGRNVLDTLMRLHNHQPPPMSQHQPDLSPEIGALVEQLLAKAPENRPASTAWVADTLRRMLGPVSTSSSDITLAPSDMPKATSREADATQVQRPPRVDIAPQVASGSSGSALVGRLSRGQLATGERRWVTVLFGDLVHRNLPDHELDPELLFELLPQVNAVVQPIIEGFQGHFSETSDLRFLAYFGFPISHGDDARRAVHCALEIRQALDALLTSQDLEWSSRQALHTGAGISHHQPSSPSQHQGPNYDRVQGRTGQGPSLTLGNTLDRTMSLRLRAAPSAVVVSSETRRRLGDAFVLETLAGNDAADECFTVISARALHEPTFHFDDTPLVGRERDLDLLVDRWQMAREGNGQVVLLSGEAGIGKSRLVQALDLRLRTEHANWQITQCSAYSLSSPLAPWRALLNRWLALDGDSPHHGALIALLEEHDLELASGVPVLGAFLGWPPHGEYPPRLLSAEKQRRETLEILCSLLLARAQRQALVLVVEDLHWADPSTLELLGMLVDTSSEAPLLLLLTARPQFRSPWSPVVPITQLHLDRLRDSDIEALLSRLAERQHLPRALVHQLVKRSDGVPLFAEELIRHLVASDQLKDLQDISQQLDADQLMVIPGSLHESLMARLDRLGSAKEIAQLAAVLGRSFSRPLLAALTEVSADDLDRQLHRLTSAGILARQGFGEQARYSFRHALLRDAAYDSLLKRQLTQYHGAVAGALEDVFPEIGKRQPEVLAHHLEAAGAHQPAIGRWLQAGMLALAQAALDESESHFTRGLALTKKLSVGAERDLLELNLLAGLAHLYSSRDGFSSLAVESVYGRSHTLVERLGQRPQLFQLTWGLWTFHIARSELTKARELAERLESLAALQPDVDHRLEVSYALGFSAFGRGDLQQAEHHLRLAAEGPGEDDASPLFMVGVNACVNLATAQWLLGHPDDALRWDNEGLRRAHGIGHPVSLVSVLVNSALLHLHRGELETAEERAEEALQLANERGFQLFSTQAQGLLGFIVCRRAPAKTSSVGEASSGNLRGLAMMARALEAAEGAGALFSLPLSRSLQATALAHSGDRQAARQVLLETFERCPEDFWFADLHRQLGELYCLGPEVDPISGRQRLQDALVIARRQGALSLELRAAMARCRHAEVLAIDPTAVRRELRQIYDRFEEGFDTADLRAAQGLLL